MVRSRSEPEDHAPQPTGCSLIQYAGRFISRAYRFCGAAIQARLRTTATCTAATCLPARANRSCSRPAGLTTADRHQRVFAAPIWRREQQPPWLRLQPLQAQQTGRVARL